MGVSHGLGQVLRPSWRQRSGHTRANAPLGRCCRTTAQGSHKQPELAAATFRLIGALGHMECGAVGPGAEIRDPRNEGSSVRGTAPPYRMDPCDP